MCPAGQFSNNTGILNTCTQLWLTESEQVTPVVSIKDVVRSSIKVPEFDKHLKKAGWYIGQNVAEITIKMKTIVKKLLMIKINKLRLRNLDNQAHRTQASNPWWWPMKGSKALRTNLRNSSILFSYWICWSPVKILLGFWFISMLLTGWK